MIITLSAVVSLVLDRLDVVFGRKMTETEPSWSPAVARRRRGDEGFDGAMTTSTTGDSYVSINVQPIAGALGAEISGVDLATELTDETVAEIRRAWLEHLVVFFRDQVLDPDGVPRVRAPHRVSRSSIRS